MAGELEVGQRQIDADGDPDLGHDGIAGGAQEALDLQVLLDPLEEQFDLPTGFVDLGDGAGGELEIVGQEIVLDAGFSILAPRRFEWNSPGNLCQITRKIRNEEPEWTATRYCFLGWV